MHISIADIRNNLADALNRAAYAGERVILERRGKPVAALVSMEDVQLLERLEDEADIRAARKARKEGGKPIPLETVLNELGLASKRKQSPKRRTAEAMTYDVDVLPGVRRALKRLPKSIQIRFAEVLRALATNPRPAGTKKMIGEENLWRIRIGDYRVLYEIHDGRLLVMVISIGHRKDVYRDR